VKHFVGIVSSSEKLTIGQKVNRLPWGVFAFPLMNQFPTLVNQIGIGGVKRGKQYITRTRPCCLCEKAQSALRLTKNRRKKEKDQEEWFHKASDTFRNEDMVRNGWFRVWSLKRVITTTKYFKT
jgi:hypothetical protein